MGDRNRGRGRPYYAPPPQRRQHSVLGYWVPLVVTGTIALGGLAAWVWSERSKDDDDYPPEHKPQRPPTGPYPTQGAQPYPGPPPPPPSQMPAYSGPIPSQSSGPQGGPPPAPVGGEAASYYSGQRSQQQYEEGEQQTFFGQVRGAMRRTPSPQQFFDQASRQVTAGIAAAGSALGSIMEDHEGSSQGQKSREQSRRRRGESEGREGFSDHERWSEEADERVRRVSVVERESALRADQIAEKGKGKARKSVVVVLSADTNMDGKMDDADVTYSEHASILSHLPHHHDPSTTDLTIAIYAPGLTSLPPLTYRPSTLDAETASNLGSSYSNINTPAATPGTELQSISPKPEPVDKAAATEFKSPGKQFDNLYTQALTLVDHPSKILCFTTVSGYISILRHLAPQLAYVSDLLAGHEGETIAGLKGWVGHSILVVGDDGTGGLADTETEDEVTVTGGEKGRWYDESNLVGLGKAVEVVDVSRVGDDWVKRVGGRE